MRLFSYDDPVHLQAAELLPWFANETLEGAERVLVEKHLVECLACTQELNELQRLRSALLDHDPAVVVGLCRIQSRLASRNAQPWRESLALRFNQLFNQWRGTARWIRFAMVAQFVLIAALGVISLAPDSPKVYHVLGSPDSSPARFRQIVVVFDPTRSGSEIRELVLAAQAKVVDGPSAEGAYTLQVPVAQFDTVLARLQNDPAVTFAGPVIR